MTKFALLAAAALLVPAAAHSAGSSTLTAYSLDATSYSQNFDDLARTGNSATLPDGWQIVERGNATAADGRYVAGTGTSNTGGIYSFGAANSTDRALGSLASGTASPLYFGGIFTNGLGGVIESLAFAYTGEQWRAGNSGDDGLFFEYSLDAASVGDDNATWISVTDLDFLPLILTGNTVLNGNENTRALSATIDGLSIGVGESFGFRWRDENSSANDHGLAVDDLGITATLAAAPVPEPATWAMMLGGFGLIGGAMRRRAVALRFA